MLVANTCRLDDVDLLSINWMDARIFDLCFERQDQRSNTEASQGKSGSFSPRPTLAKIYF